MSLPIEQQYDRIYRYCYFRVSNAALAEDLTQETFLRYFSQELHLTHGKQMAYLYTIARNLCIDTYRKKKEEELNEDIPAQDSIAKSEIEITVQQALKSLPVEEQEFILLRYVNDLSVGEIAAITELSRFAVYRRIKAALSKLKGILRKEDFYE